MSSYPRPHYPPPPYYYGYGPKPKAKTYTVPQRFSIASVLILTTVFGLLFAALRFYGAPPAVYLFFGLLAMVIAGAQIFFGKTPRAASLIAGAVMLPPAVAVASVRGGIAPFELLAVTMFCIPGGALLGYLTGTVMAGCFLVADRATSRISGQSSPDGETRPAEVTPPAGAPAIHDAEIVEEQIVDAEIVWLDES